MKMTMHDAYLLAQLVDEDDDAAGLADDAGELPERLAHEPRDDADAALAHLALELAAGQQGRDGVDNDDVQRAGAHKLLGYLERLLAGVRLGDEQLVYVDAQRPGVGGLERVLDVDVRGLAAVFLRAGHDVEREGGLAAALGAVYLHDAPAGHAAYAEGQVKRERARGDGLHVHGDVVAQAHYRALAEVLLYLRYRGLQRPALVVRRGRRSRRGLFLLSHGVTPLVIL